MVTIQATKKKFLTVNYSSNYASLHDLVFYLSKELEEIKEAMFGFNKYYIERNKPSSIEPFN
jgi:hypothetical protein